MNRLKHLGIVERTIVATVLVVVIGAVTVVLVHADHHRSAATAGSTPPSGSPTTGSSSSSSPAGPSGSTGVALGVYVKPDPAIGSAEATLGSFEASIDRHLAIVQTFTGWETGTGAMIPFPTAFASYATSVGATPMITWQPEQAVKAGSAPGDS